VRFEALKFLPVGVFGGRHQFARLQTHATAGFQPFHDAFRLPFPGADNFGKLFQKGFAHALARSIAFYFGRCE
jgi:hypothetical protein